MLEGRTASSGAIRSAQSGTPMIEALLDEPTAQAGGSASSPAGPGFSTGRELPIDPQ